METVVHIIKSIIPTQLFNKVAPTYHYALALIGALVYRFPSRKIRVVGVTGTKGKTTVSEMIYAILREAGEKTALSNTIHFIIGAREERNLFKMSMPGRMFIPRFMRRAVSAGCSWIVLEMTSQGVLQHRQRFIDLDALVFTNLSPEHIEAHGSFENYKQAKLDIARSLAHSSKDEKYMIANADDQHGEDFIDAAYARPVRFSLNSVTNIELREHSSVFEYGGEIFTLHLPGKFNIENALAAITFAQAIGIELEVIKRAIAGFKTVRGRLEPINMGQHFEVYVDYAHTVDSLTKVYTTFPEKRKVCVLGNTGGGRDKWKRSEMAQVAEAHCNHIILTNEDPYDEDPKAIVQGMYDAIQNKGKAEIIMDRRKAIRKALETARKGDVVLITGKGTDPYIMEAGGAKTPWDDATVAREELQAYLRKQAQ